MQKKSKTQSKTVKLDSKTHKLLRLYAAENGVTLKKAVQNLLEKDYKGKK
ncbi:hypothetical protein L6279_05040 [Candidatus Parcubacteria bacterium]|nr:hypothetical protein [Candidatus Parcubacteria bacterium]